MIPTRQLRSQQTPAPNLYKYLIGIQSVNDENVDNTDALLDKLNTLSSNEGFNIANNNYSDFITKAIGKIGMPIPKNCFEKTKWISCPNSNVKEIKGLLDLEINSTIYNLRILLGSFLHCPSVKNGAIKKYEEFPRCTFDKISSLEINKYKIHSSYHPTYFKPYIKFKIKDGDIPMLTGIWSNDQAVINLHIYEGQPNANGQSKRTGRLVMAFGPSAAGKSTIGANFIKALGGLPESYMTVDGGEYRKLSVMYQTIVNVLSQKKIAFSNMHGDLFDAGALKNKMIEYLKTQKDTILNLYVPDTITKCARSLSFTRSLSRTCQPIYQPYIDITGDKSHVALYIWQHLRGADCTYDATHKCVGCYESGKVRQEIEGKQYESGSYSWAEWYGKKEVARAPGGGYIIHNSGSTDRFSVVKLATNGPPLDLNADLSNTLKFSNTSECNTSSPIKGGRKTRKHKKKSKKTMRRKNRNSGN